MTNQHNHKEEYLIYVRKSTDDADNQQNSIAFQTGECQRFAERNNLPIANLTVEGYSEKGVIAEHHSAYKSAGGLNLKATIAEVGSRRPKFGRLLEDLAEGKYKGVVILSWDRASRNAGDTMLIRQMLKAGVDIQFVRGAYANDSSGHIHMGVDSMFAEHYSMVISEKVRDANQKMRAEGKTIHFSPIGYLDKGADNKPLDPERAPLVKELFEKYATGEWSFTTLAHWANKAGLTTKPRRRRRTKAEILKGMPIDANPLICYPITAKSIEAVLNNPFYMGYNVHKGELIKSTSHVPLISHELFYQVRGMLKKRQQVIRYPHLSFYTYRGLLVCGGCGRSYSPYKAKGKAYYRVPCKEGCWNSKQNVSEAEVDALVKSVLGRLAFTDEELAMIEAEAGGALDKISTEREKHLAEKQRELQKLSGDLDYLMAERITILREQVMTMDAVLEQEQYLKKRIGEVKNEISTNVETGEEMFKYVITFSELVKNAPYYFEHALDGEKHEIVTQVFSELVLTNGKLNYIGKAGFKTLLSRHYDPNWVIGAPERIRTSVD